jgi:hypothetical protein
MEDLVIQGRYEHYNNCKVYKILHKSNNRDTGEFDIVYREIGKRKVYNQSEKRFFSSFLIKGKRVPRFKLLEDKVK